VQALIAVAVIALVSLPLESLNSTTSFSAATFAQTTDSLGLRLALSDNGSYILTNESVRFSVSLFNTLPNPVNVTGLANLPNYAESGWHFPFVGIPLSPNPQCYWNDIFEFALLKGDYSQSNLLELKSGAAVVTLCMEGAPARWYLFQPQSYNATMDAITCGDCQTYQVTSPFSSNVTEIVSGYWNSSSLPTSTSGILAFTPFPKQWDSGSYTLAVGDPWGDLVALHFQVSESPGATISPFLCNIQGPNTVCSSQ